MINSSQQYALGCYRHSEEGRRPTEESHVEILRFAQDDDKHLPRHTAPLQVKRKKIFVAALAIFILLPAQSSFASPWAENSGYFGKTGGKFVYGLKNAVFGWMMMFGESQKPEYNKEWEGFCVGISKSVIYTANGLIQLATFPLPVDFPDVGRGVYIPKNEPPSSKKEKFEGAPAGKKEAPKTQLEKPEEEIKVPQPPPETKPPGQTKQIPPSALPPAQPVQVTVKKPLPSEPAPTGESEEFPPGDLKPVRLPETSKPADTVVAPAAPPVKTMEKEPLFPDEKTLPSEPAPLKEIPQPPQPKRAMMPPVEKRESEPLPREDAKPVKIEKTPEPLFPQEKRTEPPKQVLAEPVKIMKEKTPTILIPPAPAYVPASANLPPSTYQPAKVAEPSPKLEESPAPEKNEEDNIPEEPEVEIKSVSSLPSNEPLHEPVYGAKPASGPLPQFKAEETALPVINKDTELLPEETEKPSNESGNPAVKAEDEKADKDGAMDDEILKILKEAEKYQKPS